MKLQELARKAGKIAGYAAHYGGKAKETYKKAKALRTYTKKLTRPQIKNQLAKAKKLKEHRPLTRKERIVSAALRIELLRRANKKHSSKKKHTKKRKSHKRSKKRRRY